MILRSKQYRVAQSPYHQGTTDISGIHQLLLVFYPRIQLYPSSSYFPPARKSQETSIESCCRSGVPQIKIRNSFLHQSSVIQIWPDPSWWKWGWELCCLNYLGINLKCTQWLSSLGNSPQKNLIIVLDIGNQELLTVKLMLDEWRHCFGCAAHPFVVLTNHKNLENLFLTKHLNP